MNSTSRNPSAALSTDAEVGYVREKTPEVRRLKVFQTRCNPKINFKLFHTLGQHPQFRRMVSNLGLDCLFNLRLSRLQRELCADLARKVDVTKKVMTVHGTEIPLTYASVTKILGMPCTGLLDDLLVQLPKDDQHIVCSRFKLDVSAMISQNALWSYLTSAQTFDEEFKGKFLLFVIGTLIRPTTNVHIHFKEYIPLLYRIDSLSEFNWAKFLLDGLLDSINTYQIRCAKSLGGCLLYLQLLYLHCISPVPWTQLDECLIATTVLRHWTDDRVAVVVKLMREQGGVHSNRVTVRTAGIPAADATPHNYVLPQLLMHDVLLTRQKRRLDDTEIGLEEIFKHFSRHYSHLTSRLRRLEEMANTRNTEIQHV